MSFTYIVVSNKTAQIFKERRIFMAAITNQASIVYNTLGSQTKQNAVSNITSTDITAPLSLTKTALNSSYTPEDTVAYSVYLTNSSGSAITSLTFTDDMGGAAKPLSYVANSAYAYVGGVLSSVAVNGNTTFTVATVVPAGETVILLYSARTSATTEKSITNTVTALATAGETQLSETASETITEAPYSLVSIYKQADRSSVSQGQNLTYTLTLQNSGTQTAENITVTDKLPDNFTVSAVSVTQNGITTSYEPADYTIDQTTNTITLPTGTKTITIPGAVNGDPGTAVVTITGTIS